MHISPYTLLITVAAGLLPAQSAPPALVRGPLSGYLYWPADHSVRPILGYPGAAYAGTAVLSNVEFASVSPDGRWAVVVKDGQTQMLFDFKDASKPNPLLQAPDRVVWSSDRKAALLYSSTANAMQKIRLLDGSPRLEQENDLSGLGSVTALALSGEGDRVVVGTPGGVYLFTASQQPVRLAAMENPVSAVFADGGASLYILNKTAQPSIQSFHGEPLSEQDSLPIEGDVTADPVNIALSGNERYLLVAERAQRRVRIYDRSSMQFTSSLPLDCPPAALELLTVGGAFLVKPDSSGTGYSIVLATDVPRIYFLPLPGPDL